MDLIESCKNNFDTSIRNRGAGYFTQGWVKIEQSESNKVMARVQGGSLYKTQFIQHPWDSSQWLAICNCPYYQGGEFCKHLWATLLEIKAKSFGWRLKDFSKRITLLHKDEAILQEDWEGEMPSIIAREPVYEITKPAFPEWREAFQKIESRGHGRDAIQNRISFLQEERELWYGVNYKQLKEQQRVEIYFFQRVRKQDQSLGKVKLAKLSLQDLSNLTSENDRQVLKLILGSVPLPTRYPYYSSYEAYSKVVAQPLIYEELLFKLCQMQRLFYFENEYSLPKNIEAYLLTWLGHWSYETSLHAQEEGWKWSAFLSNGEQQIPIQEMLFISKPGLFFSPRGVGLFLNPPSETLVKLFKEHDALFIPQSDKGAFQKKLYSHHLLPSEKVPEAFRLPEKSVNPVPVIYFYHEEEDRRYRYQAWIFAEVDFRYEEQSVFFYSKFPTLFCNSAGEFVRRQFEQEKSHVHELMGLGFHLHLAHGEVDSLQLNEKSFLKALQHLSDKGWEIYFEKEKIHSFEKLEFKIQSEIDWFELQGEATLGEKRVSFPELLESLRKGEKFYKFKDGSLAFIPERWKMQLDPYLNLGHKTESGVRYNSSQALLIANLLQSQEQVAWDARFAQLLNKLKYFEGVRSTEVPVAFKGKLRTYQKEGLAWLEFLQAFSLGGCLADDMGLGKTIQVLALLEKRRKIRKTQKAILSLIVVPRSLVHNWKEESRKFTPRLRILDYTGKERKTQLASSVTDYDLVLTTYGTLRRDIAELCSIKFDYVILDESQVVKNASAQISKAVKLLKAKHRLALSGTPVENHLGELYSLFDFLNPGLLGSSQGFRNFLNPKNPDMERVKSLVRGLKPFILRRTKAQVLTELPKKTEQTLYCEMEGEQKQLYEELKNYYRAFLGKKIDQQGLNKTKILVLEALLRLRQAACHPGLVNPSKQNLPSAKLESLFEQIQEILEEGHKALIFSQFTQMLSIVKTKLEQEKICYEYLDGKTQKRETCINHFQQDPKCPLFLISLKAGGFGLNLTAADYVFILDPWWNPAAEAQAIDRAHRLGQTKPIFAYRLITKDTVEEKILQLQQNKKKLAEAIMSETTSLISKITREDLQFLLS